MILGRVCVKYETLPTVRLNSEESSSGSPSEEDISRLSSIDTERGLQPSKPSSSRSCKVYFLIPMLSRAISDPKSYFAGPMSRSLNADLRVDLNSSIAELSFPTTTSNITWDI